VKIEFHLVNKFQAKFKLRFWRFE